MQFKNIFQPNPPAMNRITIIRAILSGCFFVFLLIQCGSDEEGLTTCPDPSCTDPQCNCPDLCPDPSCTDPICNCDWIEKASMPTPIAAPSTGVINGIIYVVGWNNGLEGRVYAYDPATDTWTTKAPELTDRAFASTSVIGGKFYVIGGITEEDANQGGGTALKTVEVYDPITDSWSTAADMLTSRVFSSSSVVDGKIYAIGGMQGTVTTSLNVEVEVYDPTNDTWTAVADLPERRTRHGSSVVDGKIYVIGGTVFGGLSSGNVLSSVLVYDPMTDQWATATAMPTARVDLSTVELDGDIYATGGAETSEFLGQDVLSTVEKYNPVTDTWEEEPNMRRSRAGSSSGVVDATIYVFGGNIVTAGEVTISDLVEAYTPEQ